MTIGRARTLTCPCGGAFSTTAPRTKYCDTCRTTTKIRHGHGARINRTLSEGMFIGVDGEGYTLPDGTSRYTMLSVGTATLVDEDGEHLDILRIFNFLWEQYENNPGASYVGFFLAYDFWQWLATLPADRAHMLLHRDGIAARKPRPGARGGNTIPFPVRYKGWEFDMLGSVRFRLRKEGAKTWLYINDTGPYFQKSFLATINPANWQDPVCTQVEYDTIVEGKAGRGETLTPAEWVALYPDTMRYNTAENKILAVVMDRIKTGLIGEGVHLTRQQWFGPGQAAQEWLTVIGQPRGADIRAAMPPAADKAAQDSYYGGWFEIFAHGHLAGDTYEYDINSAYPAAMTHLPCLLHGAWTHLPAKLRNTATDLPYALCEVTVKGSDPVAGAMQCRRGDGTIARPHHVRGWYWGHELEAATHAGLIDDITFHDVWTYTTDPACGTECNPLPDAIAAIYQRRLDVGKNSAHGVALKIVYNSAYGKFAQSIGTPKYGNAFAASFITSWCRTQILNAIATHPEGTRALVMIATDGVYFRTPHPDLHLSPGTLGAWDQVVKHEMCLLKPGVYWDDKARANVAAGRAPGLKSRGINSADLAANLERIDEEFRAPAFLDGVAWPTIRLTKNFNLISGRSAIFRGKWHLCGQIEWQDGIPHNKMTREESADPQSKRFMMDWSADHRGDQRAGVWPGLTADLKSVPYSQTFGRLEEDPQYAQLVEDMWRDTPDGPDHYTGDLT